MAIYQIDSACPKCGAAQATTAHKSAVASAGCSCGTTTEHMHRKCVNCGFERPEEPLA